MTTICTLKQSFEKHSQEHARIALLFDENTHVHCAPFFFHLFPTLSKAPQIIIPAGEANKSIESASIIWDKMHAAKLGPNDALMSIGGGMISDIGAFCAATYKRGIDHYIIPTSLLSMIDACYGGKTAINLGAIKNQIGSFTEAKSIFIDDTFLFTLDKRQVRNGKVEMLKHLLLFEQQPQEAIKGLFKQSITQEQILSNLQYKIDVVKRDPFDKSERQALNLGHSFGHAIEAQFMHSNYPLLHGEAVLLGLIAEAHLAEEHINTDPSVKLLLEEIQSKYFDDLPKKISIQKLLPFIVQDKKNDELLRFTLLEGFGKYKIQQGFKATELEGIFA